MEFVHLHLHTEYSLLDGACRIGELLDEVAKRKMPAAAITEHGNLFSAIKFHDEARDRGVKPIIGCEVYVASGSRRARSAAPGENYNHLVLLAADRTGYHNLIKLVSAGYTEGFYYKPRIDKELLAEHAAGLIGLSACLKGEIAMHLCREQQRKALEAAANFRDILGRENFYLEMQYQGIEDQRVVNRGLPPIARELDVPLVCTNDVHYLRQADHRPHDVLLCIGSGKNVQDEKRLRYHGDQFYLKTAEEMAEVFGDYPEALQNTLAIAERCDVDLREWENHLPDFGVPEAQTVDGYFEQVVRQGFEKRLERLRELEQRGALRHPLKEYEAKLAHEIDVIERMRYPGYFLIVWDFIRYAREQGIPVGPGRGSAAGSLVAYCLGITDVDPLEFDLIFERFLNPERVSLPDIDIDFCERRRGEVIDYVIRKYGRENVAQIITFGTMKARAAIRDVGRTLGMSYGEVDRVAKQIPQTLDMTLDRALDENATLREMYQRDEQVKELIRVARRLEGITRHASVHAAGVVIAPRPLTELAPLYKSSKDEITTQWAMNDVERVGLLKMDFLGLSTLTLLHDAVAHIRETTGETLVLEQIPLDDAKTYELFGNGQTRGVFQFESSGMRETLRKARPKRFDDLIALNALYRPGPLNAGVIDDFIARKQGKVKIKYEVPELEPILAPTYGVIAYQEQVMRIAGDLAGFTMGEGDLLRKAMGKKDANVMKAQRERFVSGAVGRGIARKTAAGIFDLMEHFAGYGFNKSHSTAYSLLAYQTAYLKANYPRHFMAALLTIERQNTDKVATYLGECRDMRVPVLPPDVHTSGVHFTVAPEGVRFGLAAIKNVGEGAVKSILQVREAEGGITSLGQLCAEVDLRLVNRRVLESLIKAGAFDSLAPQQPAATARATLLAAVERALEHGSRIQRDREQGQGGLFDTSDAPQQAVAETGGERVQPWTDAERLEYEMEALGFYLSGHPVDRFAAELQAGGVTRIEDLSRSIAHAAIAGIIASKRQMTTRKGQPMAVVQLEDRGGSLECVVFPDAYDKCAKLLETGSLVVARGRLEIDEEPSSSPKKKSTGPTRRLVVEEVVPLSSLAAAATGRALTVRLASPPDDRKTLEALAVLFGQHPGGDPVSIVLELRGREQPLRLSAALPRTRVRHSDALVKDVERICGEGAASRN